MVTMEHSNDEVLLNTPCMSEMTVPYYDDLSRNCSKVSANLSPSKLPISTTKCNVPRQCSSEPASATLKTTSHAKQADCAYKAAGCTETFPHGTAEEKEHNKSCQYRPIPCLMQHVCKQLVPYHSFLLHHMKHFIYPSFSSILNTSVVFERDDFDCNHRWQPRWMNCYDKDFFVMISHKIPGMWYFWVWILGTPEEAAEFTYDIEISKKHNRKVGTFPVLSFRTGEDELEKQEICLSMTDYQVKRISQIKENLVGSLDVDLMIYKMSSLSFSRLWQGEKKSKPHN